MSIPGLQALSSSQKRLRCAAGLALRCWLKSRLLRSLSRPPKSSRNFAHSDLAGRTSADRKFNKRFLSSTLVLQIGGENSELGRKTASLQSRLRGTGDIVALQMKVTQPHSPAIRLLLRQLSLLQPTHPLDASVVPRASLVSISRQQMVMQAQV